MSRHDEHPAWCAGGHRCNLGEHRADPLTITIPDLGRVLLTRIRTADGRDHAEIRATVALAPTEAAARHQLLTLTEQLTAVLRRATRINARPDGGIHSGR